MSAATTVPQSPEGLTHMPRWDLTPFYPSPDSDACARDQDALIREIADLTALFDRHHIGQRAPGPLDDALVALFDEVVAGYSALCAHTQTVAGYLFCTVMADSRDTIAQARLSALRQHGVSPSPVPLLDRLHTRFLAWIGDLDVETLAERSAVARDHRYLLERAHGEATRHMSPAEEDLAAGLSRTGAVAWSKLHADVTAQLLVPLERDGRTESLPMGAVAALATHGDRTVRRAAFAAEVAAWERVAVPLAAALNGVKSEALTLTRRRGWASPLDQALWANGIDRATLDAMLGAARATFPDIRRFWRAKARALDLPVLARYDVQAPVGTTEQSWSFDEASAFIVAQFGSFSPRLRTLAERAFRERWIDAGPRPGKSGAGFCCPIRGDESRILFNYTPSFRHMSGIAHELGHAYHILNLAMRPVLQGPGLTPPILAETASTFCETIVAQAALRQADASTQAVILNGWLMNTAVLVGEVSARFLFESRVFEARGERELAVEEINVLMLAAQREVYGDAVDPGTLHPYAWCGPVHYYMADLQFHNFPYMFGLLFALGLYARYQQAPEAFVARYDDLLASTSAADAATLAARFDIDLRTPDFWQASLDVVAHDVDRFEDLVAAGAAGLQAGSR